VAQPGGCAHQIFDRTYGLGLGSGCGAHRVAQVHHAVRDLARTNRLRFHSFIDRGEAWPKSLCLIDDAGDLVGDFLGLAGCVTHFFGKTLHPQDAGGHRGLNLLHCLLDVECRHRSLISEASDFPRNHREAVTLFADLGSFDGGIQRKQVGLVRNHGNGGNDGGNV